MGFHLPYILALLTFLLAASHAVLSPELYWKTSLPNTPMPKAVSDLLHPDFTEEKGTSVSVGKGSGVNVNTGKGSSGGGTHVTVGKGPGVRVNTGKPGKRTNVGVGKGGVSVSTGRKGRPVYVGVNPGKNPFVYKYAASENQLHDNPNVALFFLEEDIHPGTKMNLQFTKSSNKATFLPRQVAESIPFSSNKLPEILSKFSVTPRSVEAETIKETLAECEEPTVVGEAKRCATSLESMIDFSTSKLGKDVQAVSTEVEKETAKQTYTVTQVEKKTAGDKAVACHKQNYAYAVFYCHATRTTKTYLVSMEGADGTKAKAVAVCHTDTSAWNPKHLAFQVLKVKPGTVPVCHFLPEDHIVWIPNKKSA